MRLNFLLRIFAVALTFILVGCSSTKAPEFGAPTVDADQSAKASSLAGMNAEGNFATGQDTRLKAPYNQTYYFNFDRYDVYENDVDSIKIQANYLVSHPSAKVRLEGNADERGSREYNIALGWKRARAVADILSQEGVSKGQMALVSYGKEKPVAFGHDEDSYRLNRRVNLVYEAK
jgi:peptidoglycan-associated lipoprotein